MARRASPGEGRPYQRRADGRWVVVVRDSANRRRYLYGLSSAEVIEKRDAFTGAVRTGWTPPTGRLSVGDQLQDWLADRRGKVRPTTWVSYEGVVRVHLGSIERIHLVRLSPVDVRRLLRERTHAGCSPRTTRYALTVLRMALGQAVRDGLVARNVATAVTGPRITREELRVWSPSEARRFLAATSEDPLGSLWAVLLGTGMRLGEALGLRWSDVNLGSRTLAVSGAIRIMPRAVRASGDMRLQRLEPKTEAGWRTIALADFVVDGISSRQRAQAGQPKSIDGYIFTTPRGTPVDPRNANREFERAMTAVGLPRIRLHDLRHTAASLLLAQGFTLEDVKRILGHSSIAMTSDIYGHLVAGRSRELADGMQRMLGGSW